MQQNSYTLGCVKFLHRRFRSISTSSALSAIQTDYTSESRKARRTRKTQKKRVLLKSLYNRQFSNSQDHACSTFILDCASFFHPYNPLTFHPSTLPLFPLPPFHPSNHPLLSWYNPVILKILVNLPLFQPSPLILV